MGSHIFPNLQVEQHPQLQYHQHFDLSQKSKKGYYLKNHIKMSNIYKTYSTIHSKFGILSSNQVSSTTMSSSENFSAKVSRGSTSAEVSSNMVSSTSMPFFSNKVSGGFSGEISSNKVLSTTR